MTSTASWDPSYWGDVFTHEMPQESFDDVIFRDGVHRFEFKSGLCIELLFKQEPFNNAEVIPVILGGAVANRTTTTGPYFSGTGIAERLDIGVIAISDPILPHDPTINIGWYTGLPGHNSQEEMGRIFCDLGRATGKKFLFIGGSAGGYGALELASRVHGSMVFAWNPQTSILSYSEPFVKKYLSVMFDEDWECTEWKSRAKGHLEQARIVHDITSLEFPAQGLVIQNDSDWHLRAHMAPYLRNRGEIEDERGYFGNQSFGVLVYNFGRGHAVPSSQVVEMAISHLMQPDSNASTAVKMLGNLGQFENTNMTQFPLDLSPSKSMFEETLRGAAYLADQRLKVVTNWGEIGQPNAKLRVIVNHVDGTSTELSQGENRDEWGVRCQAFPASVEVIVMDGFGHRAVVKEIEVRKLARFEEFLWRVRSRWGHPNKTRRRLVRGSN